MAIYFGLNVNKNLTEIDNKTETLKNLNLNIEDLDYIRGVTDPGGVSRDDFRTLAGLDLDFEKYSVALNQETSLYPILTSKMYDENSFVKNNITINGQLAAKSLKYNYIDFDDNNNLKLADISTSRVSAWSSFSTPQVSSSPIFYGGEVVVENDLDLSILNINSTITQKRFAAEVPTHKIKTTIGGEVVYLYAMKGIPLKFDAFFRVCNIFAVITKYGGTSGPSPSWVVTNKDSGNEYIYKDVLVSTTSKILFTDSSPKARIIEFYYPPDNINQLNLPNIGITSLPAVVLPNLTQLILNNNDLREMPDLTGFTSLTTLDLTNNDLTRSGNISLTTFSNDVKNRLPSSIQQLILGNCYSGPSSINLSSLTSLSALVLNTNTFGRRLSGTSPEVNPSSITRYEISNNLFSSIHNSVKNSTTLQRFISIINPIVDNNLYFNSSELRFLYLGNSTINVVDVSNKTKLIEYQFISNVVSGTNEQKSVTSKFNGCTSLKTINFDYSDVSGNFPTLTNCNSLETITFFTTSITNASTNFIIDSNTFNSCRKTLKYIRVSSNKFTLKPFHPDSLKGLILLSYFEMTSQKAGINGEIGTLFTDSRNLRFLLMYNNNLTGTIPNFSNSGQLFYVHLNTNAFTGSVPNIANSSLSYLYLSSNQLSTFNSIDSVNLIKLHLSFNKITRIPNMSNLKKLEEFYFNNQSPGVGQRVSYTGGAFSGMTAIRDLNLSNNNLTQGDVDQILTDLDKNYIANPRRGVNVNLRGNSAPSSAKEITAIRNRLTGAGWILQI